MSPPSFFKAQFICNWLALAMNLRELLRSVTTYLLTYLQNVKCQALSVCDPQTGSDSLHPFYRYKGSQMRGPKFKKRPSEPDNTSPWGHLSFVASTSHNPPTYSIQNVCLHPYRDTRVFQM